MFYIIIIGNSSFKCFLNEKNLFFSALFTYGLIQAIRVVSFISSGIDIGVSYFNLTSMYIDIVLAAVALGIFVSM